jgi:FMN phosphatase YigB (HAD superfamily)
MRAKTVFKRCYCFDLDDTLIKTPAKIYVYRNGSFVKSLTPKEYNFYKHQPGDKLDFKDFLDGEMILKAEKYTVWSVIKNISVAIKQERSTSDIYILTARDSTVKSYIYEFLKQNGIEIDLENIITMGDNKGNFNIADEKRKILSELKNNYDEIILFDDNPKTIQLAASIPGIKTKLIENMKSKKINEDMGGVSTPISTLMNTPGMGNPTPANINSIGSGDKWGNTINGKPYTQANKPKSKKKKTMKKTVKKVEENNINPYDKIAVAMAKKMKTKIPFKKKNDPKNQNAMVQKKYEHQIITFDQFKNSLNEDK